MKTNTNLAMISFDVLAADSAATLIEEALLQTAELLVNSQELLHHSTIWTAHKRLADSLYYLKVARSEMKTLARKSRIRYRKSSEGTRATNRAITGIG